MSSLQALVRSNAKAISLNDPLHLSSSPVHMPSQQSFQPGNNDITHFLIFGSVTVVLSIILCYFAVTFRIKFAVHSFYNYLTLLIL